MKVKTLDFVMIAMVLAAATATYVLKYGSEIESNANAKLAHQISEEKAAIDILKANWSLLTNPARIQTLAKRHLEELKLEIIAPSQIVTLDDIPTRPIELPTISTAENDNKKDGISALITGGINSEGKP